MGFSVCVSSEATCSSLFSLLPSLRPIPSTATMVLSHMPMATPLLAFLSDPPLDWTPSPRALMLPPRDTSPTPTDTLATDTSDTTTARGLLTLRLIPTTSVVTLSPTPPTVLLLPLSPSDPPPAWTPSPRALTPPPRGTLPTPTATSATTTVKFRELTRHVC